MKGFFSICLLVAGLSLAGFSQSKKSATELYFFGDTLGIESLSSVSRSFSSYKTIEEAGSFLQNINLQQLVEIAYALTKYKEQKKLDDWLFYQLIRAAAEKISPKQQSFHQYTLYKWALLNHAGYDASIRMRADTMLLYIQSNELVYDVPFYSEGDKQFVCLNYHDYGIVDFSSGGFKQIKFKHLEHTQSFSYKINDLPDFKHTQYAEKDISFDYAAAHYSFKVKLNKDVKQIFTNYPTVDYPLQFSIPLSKTTYQSLIPALKKEVAGMSQKKGVEYLMYLTRSSFAFENDSRIYGKEKRLSPEQTLLYDYSDCEDRSAFFFYLVKEIYQLPMIVLSYPSHITVAVQFDKPMGNPIVYNGSNYWVCEPSPQKKDLRVGKGLPSLKNELFQVVYEYKPR